MVRRFELVTNCFYEAKCTTKSKCLCGVALPLLGDLRMATDLAADSRLLHWTLQNLLILFRRRWVSLSSLIRALPLRCGRDESELQIHRHSAIARHLWVTLDNI